MASIKKFIDPDLPGIFEMPGKSALFIDSMKMLKRLIKFSGHLLIGFMFGVCVVFGVVPIIPKRKEQFEIEIKAENVEKLQKNTTIYAAAEKT